MKIFILLYSVFGFLSDSSLYSISFEQANGRTIEMSSFKGKRFIVVVVDSESPDLKHLDRIYAVAQKSSKTPEIIVVPTSSRRVDGKIKSVSSEFALLNKNIMLSKAVNTGKGSEQHPLAKWLTHVAGNGHFDRDVEDGMLFMINEKGILYGVHTKQILSKQLKEILELDIKEQDNSANISNKKSTQ